MKICGACERELPRESFSGKQWWLRKSLRRCGECVAAGNELVLFTKGRERAADDECPICSRWFPVTNWEQDKESTLYTCCMKTVCYGCSFTAKKRGINGCLFCRTATPETDEKKLSQIQKRAKANDPEAIHWLGLCYRDGKYVKTDASKAVELLERAAELGLIEAHFHLGDMFDEGTDDAGVSPNMARAVEHYELAAKQCHVLARNCLGWNEARTGNCGLALKHFMISAKLGHSNSLDEIKEMYTEGLASKLDYADALRGYHDAVEEMNSPERDEARVYWAKEA